MKNVKGVILICALFVSQLCSGAVYYVTTSGSDANDGLSESNSWPLAYAFSQAMPGDTVEGDTMRFKASSKED